MENLQYAALPWRRAGDGSLEVLLITTKRTQRWIVPKGWPIDGIAPHRCAALEALEEAGVEGTVARAPFGSFPYEKRRRIEGTLSCTVLVFPLEVTGGRENWPEKHLRQTRWCQLAEASEMVGDPGLRRLLLKFGKVQSGRRAQHRRATAVA